MISSVYRSTCFFVGLFLLGQSFDHHVMAQESAEEAVADLSGRWVNYNAGIRELGVYSFLSDPIDPQRLYLSTSNAIYRTLDGGYHWERVHAIRGHRSRSSDARAVERERHEELVSSLSDEEIARVEEHYQFLIQELYDEVSRDSNEVTALIAVEAAEDDLLLQALDDVASQSEDRPEQGYEAAEEGAPNRVPVRLLSDNNWPGFIWAVTANSVLRSDDYGHTWRERYRVNQGHQRIVSAEINGGVFLLGTASGLKRSDDGGDTWYSVTQGPGNHEVRWLGAAPGWPGIFYLVSNQRLFRSEDGGVRWRANVLPGGVSDAEVRMLEVDPVNPDRLILVTDLGLFQSGNGGLTFRRLGTVGLRGSDLAWISYVGDDLLLASSDGCFLSQDGGESWRHFNEGLTASRVHVIGSDAGERVWIGTQDGVYLLTPITQFHVRETALRRLYQQWASEPGLGQVIQVGLDYNALRNVEVESWSNRIRWRHVVPSLHMVFRHVESRDESNYYVPSDVGGAQRIDYDVTRNREDEFLALLVWNFEELLGVSRVSSGSSNSERLSGGWMAEYYALDPRESASSVADRLVAQRTDLIQRLIRTYQGRRELMLRVSNRGESTLLREISDNLEIAELTARLDIMTGGFFTAYLTLNN